MSEEKRKRGRPRIHPPKDPNAPKRPRGRPRKEKPKKVQKQPKKAPLHYRPEIRTECPVEMRLFVEKKVAEYGLKSPSEYVRRLIRKEMDYECKRINCYKLHVGTEYVITRNLEPYKRFTSDADYEIEPYFPESEGWDMWDE